jgi:hypothetical protein
MINIDVEFNSQRAFRLVASKFGNDDDEPLNRAYSELVYVEYAPCIWLQTRP